MDQPLPKNLRIRFLSESLEQFIERYAIDVTRAGIFIRTREPPEVGTPLKLDFQYRDGSPLMAGDGSVVWIRKPDPNRPSVPPGMGVRFDHLTPESQAVLELLLTEKAAREKSGASHSIAGVRRPSSIFAALEQNEAKTTVGPMPSAPPVAEPAGGQAEPPARQSIAAVRPAAQGTPGMTKAPAQARSTGAGAPMSRPPTATDAPAAGGYKPLGNARNPFAVGGASSSAKGDPAAVARMAATILGTGAKGPASLSLRDLGKAAGRADDLDEEPTQIAGRVPAFLASDEDPTSVGAHPTADDSRITIEQPAATGRNVGNLTSLLGRPSESRPISNSNSTVRAEASPGRVTESVSDPSSASLRPKASLDSMPPIGGTSSPPDRGTDALLDAEPRFSRSGLGMPERPRPFDPLAAFGSGPAAVAEAPVTAPQDAPPAPARTTPPIAIAALPAAPTAARPAAKRSSGLMVGAIVLVLGGAALFVFRFFQSQASQVVSVPSPSLESSTAVTVAAAPPARDPAVPPGSAATKVGAGEPSPASGEAKAGEAKGGEAKAGEAKAGETKADEAKSGEAKADEAKSGEARPAEEKAATAKTAQAAAKPLATAERKVAKRKPPRGARDPEATEPVEAPPSSPAPAAAPPAARAAPVTPSESNTGGHQIRVTSKPTGADVAIDGQLVGQTPLTAGISDVSAPHFVSLRKDGFEPFEQMISGSSAWAKGKSTKGQPAIPTLKINAKLKSVAAAGGDAKAAPAGDAAKEPGGAKVDPDSPAPPSDMAPTPSAP